MTDVIKLGYIENGTGQHQSNTVYRSVTRITGD